MPFGETINLGRHEERFANDLVIEERGGKVKFRYEHGETVGGMIERSSRADGIYGVFKVSETRTGDDVLALARDGNLGLSVGFLPIESRMEGSTKVQTAIDLREVSAVGIPAYTGSEITSVRSKEMAEEVKEEVVETFDSAAFQKEMEARLEERMAEFVSKAPKEEVKETRSVRDIISAKLQVVAADMNGTSIPTETRQLADVIGDLGAADASGLLYDTWVPELIGYLDARRNLFAATGTVQFPSHGYGLVFPNTTQRTVVAARTGEKALAATQAYQADQVTFDMVWFAGAVDVALELISQATNPAILSVITDDLLDQYALVTEADMVTKAEAAATASGAGIDFTDYSTFIADLIASSAAIRIATGRPGDMLAVITASWQSVLGLVDSDNRRMLATSGAVNADGSALFIAEAVNIGGINIFHSPASVVDLQFNTKSLRKSEKPPTQVSTTNVSLMGRDLGVIGATIVLPLYPAGVIKYSI